MLKEYGEDIFFRPAHPNLHPMYQTICKYATTPQNEKDAWANFNPIFQSQPKGTSFLQTFFIEQIVYFDINIDFISELLNELCNKCPYCNIKLSVPSFISCLLKNKTKTITRQEWRAQSGTNEN